MKRMLLPALLAGSLMAFGAPAAADQGPCVSAWFDSDDHPIVAVDWSPGAGLVFGHGLDGTVRVWSIDGGAPLATLPDQQRVGPQSVIAAPDGAHVAITGPEYSTVLADADTLETVWSVPEGGHPTSFSSDGRYLATGRYGVARILDADTGEVVAERVVAEGKPGYFFFGAEFLAGDRWVLLVDPAAPPRLWDWQADKTIALPFRKGSIRTVVSADRTRFAVGEDLEGAQAGWRVWDAAEFLDGRADKPTVLQRRLPVPDGSAVNAFTPDGRQLVGGAFDRKLTFWDIRSAKPVRTFQTVSNVGGARISADGTTVLVGGRPTRLYLLDGQDYFDGPVPMPCTDEPLD